MAVIVNGDGILTGISSLATSLTDITSGRGTVTGVATVGTLQLGAGVSISSPRTQQAAIFTNNTEFLTVDDAGRVGVGTITPNSDAHPENEKKINVGFITARSVAGDIDANTLVVAGLSTFTQTSAHYGIINMFDKNINLQDSDGGSGTDNRVVFGASSDLQIYHSGSHSFIDHTNGTGHLILGSSASNNVDIMKAGYSEYMARFKPDSSVDLYWDGNVRFNTTPSGADVTGTLNVSGISTFTGNVFMPDNAEIRLGASGDLQLFHHSTTGEGRIYNSNAAGINIITDLLNVKNNANNETMIKATNGGAVELYHNNTKTAETISNGFEVFGNLIAENDGAGSGTSEIQLQPYGDDGYINCTATGSLYTRMGTSYAIRTQIDGSGNFIVQSGNLKLATAGKGIDFSATSDGSGTDSSELLDDYEEGTFTPGLTSSGGSFTSMPYSERHGFYVKIGRNVQVWIRLRLAGSGVDASGATGYLYLNGLPYTVASTSSPNTAAEGGTFVINYYGGLSNLNNAVPTGYSHANTNHILMMTTGEGSNSPTMSPTAFNSNSAQVYGFMSYFTA